MKNRGTLIAGAIVLASLPQAVSAAPSNTALSQAEIDEIMNRHCVLERGYAAAVADADEWPTMMRVANRVLAENRDYVVIRRMIDDAQRLAAGGNRVQRELAQFQMCLLDNKIAYAEARERRAKR